MIDDCFDDARGEKKLLWAVIERAIYDYLGKSPNLETAEMDKATAEVWLFQDDYDDVDFKPPLTFAWICETLDLDLEVLRNVARNLPRWRRGGSSKYRNDIIDSMLSDPPDPILVLFPRKKQAS